MQRLFYPARLLTESMSNYDARRFDAKREAQRITLTGPFKPAGISARRQHRDALRGNGSMAKHAGAFGRGLRNQITRNQLAALS